MSPLHARFTRRQALALIATTLASTAIPAGAVALAAEPGAAAGATAVATTFARFCDTLLPADDFSPAASALGVPARILADAEGNALFGRLIEVSIAWLDQAAGGAFDAADASARDAIARTMSELPWEAPPRRFFDLIRDLAMGYYYAQPAAWKGSAITQPPQPFGHFESVE